MEFDATDPRRVLHWLGSGPKALTGGSDDIEVARSDDRNEPFADWMNEPPIAAHEARDGHALHVSSALDACFKDVGDARVKAVEEGIEAAQQPRLEDGVGW